MSRRRAWLRNSLGFSALELLGVMGVITVLASFILMWSAQAQARGRETSCQSNLRQIALALQMYAEDNAGRLPPSEEAAPAGIYPYLKNWQLLTCPSDRAPRTVRIDGADQELSYFLAAGVCADDPPSTVIVGDTAPRHRGGWNAVCLDGHTQRLSAGDLPRYVSKGESEDAKRPTGLHPD